jgi:dCMP deaminase
MITCLRHGRLGCLVCGSSDNSIKEKLPRLSIDEYALQLAEVAAKRSEDPYQQVGAVALSKENRIIATAYNGVAPKFQVLDGFWDNRDFRLLYMLHAEQNLCSLFTRGEVETVATTLCPCSTCMTLLIAHGVKRVIYREEYGRDNKAHVIASFYKVDLVCVAK